MQTLSWECKFGDSANDTQHLSIVGNHSHGSSNPFTGSACSKGLYATFRTSLMYLTTIRMVNTENELEAILSVSRFHRCLTDSQEISSISWSIPIFASIIHIIDQLKGVLFSWVDSTDSQNPPTTLPLEATMAEEAKTTSSMDQTPWECPSNRCGQK